MRIIVFSDIHSNIEAFNAFLAEAGKIEHDKMICIGDIVGYAANPNECAELMRERGIISVYGNHDYYISRSDVPRNFNRAATTAVEWQIGCVTGENKKWLIELPPEHFIDLRFGKAMFIHGSPAGIFDYIVHNLQARAAVSVMLEEEIMMSFVGHSHIPGVWKYKDIMKRYHPRDEFEEPDDYEEEKRNLFLEIGSIEEIHHKGEVHFDFDDMAVVNAGSIGQPRDGDARGSFVLIDDKERTIKLFRFEYDNTPAQKKIRDAGLPGSLADRLASGR